MPSQRDPYDGFKDDKERGRSLRTRERWRSAAWAIAGTATAIVEALRWLMR